MKSLPKESDTTTQSDAPTPFQRFERLTKQLLAVPKAEAEKQQQPPKQTKKKPKPATK